MRVLVVGSGGREHALVHALARRDANARQIFCAPGNAGIAETATIIPVKGTDIKGLAQFAQDRKITLTIAGGETSLAAGLADSFAACGLPFFGPSLAATQLEASKVFAKDFMARYGIPTARYQSAATPVEALASLRSGFFGAAETPVAAETAA